MDSNPSVDGNLYSIIEKSRDCSIAEEMTFMKPDLTYQNKRISFHTSAQNSLSNSQKKITAL
jgi:hypothetical protein